MTVVPVLYSFRRCPYAIRARLAILAAGQKVELREVVLRNKPEAFLQVSPSATVPCLKLSDEVLDESLDIMRWALHRHDPESWLTLPQAGFDLVEQSDGPFKAALDRTKYANRYPDSNPEEQRALAHGFLYELNGRLEGQEYLFGATPSLADMAILPFVRQFAFIDKPRFDAEDWPHLAAWLARFLDSARFASVMSKYPAWAEGAQAIYFGAT